LAQYGFIDVIIHATNTKLDKKFDDLSNEEIDDALMVNTQVPIWITKEILPLMKKENKGAIVSILGDNEMCYGDRSSAYTMSKAAVEAMMSSIRMELKLEDSQVDIITATLDSKRPLRKVEKVAKNNNNNDDAGAAQQRVNPLRNDPPVAAAEDKMKKAKKSGQDLGGSIHQAILNRDEEVVANPLNSLFVRIMRLFPTYFSDYFIHKYNIW